MACTDRQSQSVFSEIIFATSNYPADMEIHCNDAVFHVSSRLLIKVSDFFRVQLSERWTSADECRVYFKTSPPSTSGLMALLRLIYFDDVNSDTMEAVMECADFLQVTLKTEHFVNLITVQNWVKVLKIATKYNQAILVNKVCDYVAAHYEYLVNTERYKQINTKHKDTISKKVESKTNVFQKKVLISILLYTSVINGTKENLRCFYDDYSGDWYQLSGRNHLHVPSFAKNSPENTELTSLKKSLHTHSYARTQVLQKAVHHNDAILYHDVNGVRHLIYRTIENDEITIFSYYSTTENETLKHRIQIPLCFEATTLRIEDAVYDGRCIFLIVTTVTKIATTNRLHSCPYLAIVTLNSSSVMERNQENANTVNKVDGDCLFWQRLLNVVTQNDNMYIITMRRAEVTTIYINCYIDGKIVPICERAITSVIDTSLVNEKMYFLNNKDSNGIMYYSFCGNRWGYIPYPQNIEKAKYVVGLEAQLVPRDSAHFNIKMGRGAGYVNIDDIESTPSFLIQIIRSLYRRCIRE